jgi:hypothetical protein
MFRMMNEARVGVGLGAAALGYTGYLHALEYARQRPQGRKPDQRDPEAAQVAIIEHADVKRMLLAQKALAEGGLALSLYCARLVDEVTLCQEDQARLWEMETLLGVLTPVAKAWPSKFCLEANDLAIQVHGGYGYTRDYPVERFYRDNRLNPIHEGTNGIQAIDLLGRKVARSQGQAPALLLKRVRRTVAEARGDQRLEGYARALELACEEVTRATMVLLETAGEGQVELFLANASVYLDMFGHAVVAWLWLCQAQSALAALDGDPNGQSYYLGKLQACRYFFTWELPRVHTWAALLSSLDDTCLRMDPDWF